MKFLHSCLEIGCARRTLTRACPAAPLEPRLQGWKEHYETSSVTSSYPVSLDAHVTFEAGEAIFTLNNREGKKQSV